MILLSPAGVRKRAWFGSDALLEDRRGIWSIIEKATSKPEAGGTTYDIDQDGDIDVIFGQNASANKNYEM